MKHYHFLAFTLLSIIITFNSYADSVVVYDLTYPDGKNIKQTISINGRWLRIDTEPRGQSDYTLLDTGRLLKFDIFNQSKSYQVTRMGKLFWPDTPANNPRFKPLRKKAIVSGARCQQVNEISLTGTPLIKHCMAPTSSLGFNSREMITLSRLFMTARRSNSGWPAVATLDERQVSVSSVGNDGTIQKLSSVKHGKLPYTQFKIPVEFQRISPDLPGPALLKKPVQKPLESEEPMKKKRYNQDL